MCVYFTESQVMNLTFFYVLYRNDYGKICLYFYILSFYLTYEVSASDRFTERD